MYTYFFLYYWNNDKVYSNPAIKSILPILFEKCIQHFEGKRKIRFLSLSEYIAVENNTIVEVDDDSRFSVSDFFKTLGKYKDDFILVYSYVLDSTQTFLQQYCQDLQNIVCVADVQTQGRGTTLFEILIRPKVECLGLSFGVFNVFL